MNILIIGEYSAFGKYLKEGFIHLGHNVCIVNGGDGYKQIPSDSDDIKYQIKRLKLFGWNIRHTSFLLSYSNNKIIDRELKNKVQMCPDIIFVLNNQFLRNDTFMATFINSGVLISQVECWQKQGAKIIMSCCGLDPAFVDYVKRHSKFPPIKGYWHRNIACFHKLIQLSDIIIPTTIDYKSSITEYIKQYKFDMEKISKVIPLPISTQHLSAAEESSCMNRKVIIFHGINKPVEKGTSFFRDAMKRIEEEFRERVECIIVEKLPYNEYVKVFDRIDILLDQVYGSGMGINAGIGLMSGKVVLGGNSKESETEIGVGPCPIINVEPESQQIYETIKDLVLHPVRIEVLKKTSREYALKYLKPEIIAQRYIDCVL